MNDNDKKCLVALDEISTPDEVCCAFSPVIEKTGLNRREVRLAVRRLARKGLAEYHKGLWSEDGEPAGAGYCITFEGQDKLKELNDETPGP